MEFGKKNFEKKFGKSETFYRSKFSRATGVIFHGTGCTFARASQKRSKIGLLFKLKETKRVGGEVKGGQLAGKGVPLMVAP